MTSELIATNDTEKPVWGEANPKRGINDRATANRLVNEFPCGTLLTSAEFDAWAAREGLLQVPHEATPKQSDAWKAHLHRRHELKYRLVKAGTHPDADTPFTIVTHGSGKWEVCSPEIAISHTKSMRKIESLTETKLKQLGFLMQSADWSALPPYEKSLAEAVYDDISNFKQITVLSAQLLDAKFDRVRQRLESGVKRGEIHVTNGGLTPLLTQSVDTIDMED